MGKLGDNELYNLRVKVNSLSEKNKRLFEALTRARTELIDMNKKLEQVAKPPATISPCLDVFPEDSEVEVKYGGRIMRLAAHPSLDLEKLQPGTFLRISETMVAVSVVEGRRIGDIVTVQEVIDDDRLLVTSPSTALVALSMTQRVKGANVRSGDTLIADLSTGYALDKIVRRDVEQLLAPSSPNVSYSDIGGLSDQIEHVRDAVELPFKKPELYRSYGLKPPKGVLLYGPPGCGKTLIAKAIATSLGQQSHGKSPYFLSIKGPELLSKFVGETERQIRAIFARARSLASKDIPVVIFFDEMEALFRTRGSGISSDVETMIVPQLLAEMDGIETLDNVIVIGASNREDMIDPAVLRAGRLDVRVRIDRPDKKGAKEIMDIHLKDDVPVDETVVEAAGSRENAVEWLRSKTIDMLYRNDASTAVCHVAYSNGFHETRHVSDMMSGAMIAAVVERAKKLAIKDILTYPGCPGVAGGFQARPSGLTVEHMERSVAAEVADAADLSAASDPNQWEKTTSVGATVSIASITPCKHDVKEGDER